MSGGEPFVEPKRKGKPRENCVWQVECEPVRKVRDLLCRVVNHKTGSGSFTDEDGCVHKIRATTVLDELPKRLRSEVRKALANEGKRKS